jgi:hypothetical protein
VSLRLGGGFGDGNAHGAGRYDGGLALMADCGLVVRAPADRFAAA